MHHILIVEDDIIICEELAKILCNNGYQVCTASTFYESLRLIKSNEFQLVLLDINLPDQDGFKLCTEIRLFSQVPIIFVTSRSSEMDELKGIVLGGDDYIRKPYNTAILLAKIEAVIKRAYPEDIKRNRLIHKGIILDLEMATVEYNGKKSELTKNEIKILSYLFNNKGKIVSRMDIIEHLWDNHIFTDDNTLSVNISRIRNKLKQIGAEDIIITKFGMGYMV